MNDEYLISELGRRVAEVIDQLPPPARAHAAAMLGPDGLYTAELRVRLRPERRVTLVAVHRATGEVKPVAVAIRFPAPEEDGNGPE